MEHAIWQHAREISERIIVEGDLILQTPTTFGGEQENSLVDLPLLRDPLEGKGLLVGSSLAGALRNYLRERELGFEQESNFNALESTLFGFQDGTNGEQSYLIVYDALSNKPRTEIRDGVKLDSRSRTVDENKKYDFEMIEAGTVFPVHFDLALPKNSQKQVALVKALAIALEGLEKGEIHLGGRKRRGLGLCRVAQWKVHRYNLLTPKGLTDWIENSQDGAVQGNNIADLLGCDKAAVEIDSRETFTINGTFALEGSILIRSTSTDPGAPDSVHLHSKHSGRDCLVVSGTSLAGALRGRALRICKTLNASEKAGQMVETVFGPEITAANVNAKASKLIVEETEIDNPLNLVQTRVKIDRFTGGTYPSALFNEQPVFSGEDTRIKLQLILQKPTEAQIGLILLLLKDLWTADLPIGGTISVGRGRIRGELVTLQYKRKDLTETWMIKDSGRNIMVEGDKTRLEKCVQQLKEGMEE